MPNVVGEFYSLGGNRIIRVENIEPHFDGHRTDRYIHGPFLRLDEMSIGYDTEGHLVYYVGAIPITKEEKLSIRAKFAKARKLKIFREFFRMK